YLAFGPGAARYLDGRRETNHRSVTAWLKRVQAGQSPTALREQLPPEEAARERLVIGLRLTEGVKLVDFQQQTGYAVDELAAAAIERHVAADLLERTPTHLRLTREGRFLADSVFVDLL
ncbi:MAG: coproporphyrinogen III oxidase, partial [Planctomycetaceae bacterium]